ncbi:MerR family transcriptional regulator [Nocardia beijingensis]|nr:MerR family transcriptional regulator [Nocardia beijingensis]
MSNAEHGLAAWNVEGSAVEFVDSHSRHVRTSCRHEVKDNGQVSEQLLSIGDAADRLGVSTHLLRHWEAVGVVTPRRTASGARRYDAQSLDALSIAVKCQQAGMPLTVIAQLLNGERRQRRRLVVEQRDSINRKRARLEQAANFFDHVLECSHPLVRECPACRDFAAS